MQTLRQLIVQYRAILAFMALMVMFRSAVADYNVVPSGSMLPTVWVGDRILVDKMAYDLRVPLTHIRIARLGEPRRGDIVTVDSRQAGQLLLKRVIGLPGDVVQLRNNVLSINGQVATYTPAPIQVQEQDQVLDQEQGRGSSADPARYRDEHLGGMSHLVQLSPLHPSLRSDYGPVVVPPEHYLMLGDNRDNSADSRYYGLFGRDELMGRTRRVAFSLDAWHLRPERTGMRLDGVNGGGTATPGA